jgi:hypothetical protein
MNLHGGAARAGEPLRWAAVEVDEGAEAVRVRRALEASLPGP